MMGTTHLITGFFTGLILIRILDTTNPLLFIILITVFAVFPDIDFIFHFYHKKFKKPGFLKHFEHRKIFHTLHAALFFAILSLIFLDKYASLAVLIGYLLHLIHDAISGESGIQWFYPYGKRMYGKLKSIDKREWAYHVLLIILITVILINY